ncbi:MAG: hypothetical protein ACOY9C_12855 [Pseudomonadota bacterium]
MKVPALLAEDGAVFNGSVTQVDRDLYRATCWAEIDRKSEVQQESPEYFMAPSRDAALDWIRQQGARRGFASWRNHSRNE